MKNLLTLGIGLLLYACVQPYDAHFSLNTDLLVVSGIITDLDQPQTISLTRSRSRPNTDSASLSTPVTQATVEVVVDSVTRLSLLEIQPGVYRLPNGFRGEIGHRYQLRFRTIEGASYESSVETMAAVAPILRVYDQFRADGPKKTADALPTPVNDVFVDFRDPADARNFYFWRWRLYEIQSWCATCRQGRYVVRDVGPAGAGPIEALGCVRDSTLNTFDLFDYTCRGLCWDIFYSSTVTIAADIFTNGQLQTGQRIASVPIYQRDPALIVVEQLSLSANAYRYYKLFADQLQNTGTLADSPPAPIAGNVRNVANPDEKVIGYFSAASVAVQSHKILRNDTPANAGRFQGLFYAENGRNPVTERPRDGGSSVGVRVPSAICIPGRNRTNQLPPGWND